MQASNEDAIRRLITPTIAAACKARVLLLKKEVSTRTPVLPAAIFPLSGIHLAHRYSSSNCSICHTNVCSSTSLGDDELNTRPQTQGRVCHVNNSA